MSSHTSSYALFPSLWIWPFSSRQPILLFWLLQVYLFLLSNLLHLSLIPAHLSLMTMRGTDRWWPLSVWWAAVSRGKSAKCTWEIKTELWPKFIEGVASFWLSSGIGLQHLVCSSNTSCYSFFLPLFSVNKKNIKIFTSVGSDHLLGAQTGKTIATKLHFCHIYLFNVLATVVKKNCWLR